jgi:hypothetical protein
MLAVKPSDVPAASEATPIGKSADVLESGALAHTVRHEPIIACRKQPYPE